MENMLGILFIRAIHSTAAIGLLLLSALGAAKLTCDEKLYVSEFAACGTEIGRSVEKRPIHVFQIGQGGKKILLIGGLHTGTEKNTYLLAGKILRHFAGKPRGVPENIILYIIPKANPDGIARGTHNNARDVDLNRNWPSSDWLSDPYHPTYGYRKGAGGKKPLSEPETNEIYNFIAYEKPDLTVVWHSQAGTVEDNDINIADPAAELYARAAGYKHIEKWPYYEATGTFLKAMKEIDFASLDVELRSRKVEFDQNLKGVKAVLDYLETNPQVSL